VHALAAYAACVSDEVKWDVSGGPSRLMQPEKNSTKGHQSAKGFPRQLDSARFGVWDWNIETGELVWSPECLEMFGLPLDYKMSYERFLEAIYPEDRESVDRAVKAALETGNHYATEMRSLWADGSVHWIASRGRAYYNKAGKPIRMSGAGFDITLLKETEEELRRARAEAKAYAENLATVVDAIPAITFFSRDREGRTMTAGRLAREVFGLPEDVNVSLSDPEVRERFNFQWLEDGRALTPEELPVQKAASTGKAVGGRKFEVRFPDGRIVYLLGHAVPLLDAAGQSRGAVGAFLDISEMQSKEAELRDARAEAKAQAENLSAILDAMPAAAFIAQDSKCEHVVSNRAAYELLRMPYGTNTSMSASVDQRPNIVILENGSELTGEELPLQKAAATGEPVRGKELEIRFADGSSIFEFGHAVPLFDEAGNVRGAIGAYLDVTDRKVMEERLRAANERFQVALRNTPITVFNQGLDLRYKWIYNPSPGYSPVDFIGKRDDEVFERAEDAAKMEAIKSEVICSGKFYQGEIETYARGKTRIYHVTVEPQRDAQNKIIGVTCASFDLTESKSKEAEREKLAKQRQLALDAARMGWWRLDRGTNITTWDDRFKEILGLAANSGLPEIVQARIHPDDREAARAKADAALSSGNLTDYSNEYRVIRPDGSVRWVESHGAPEVDGDSGRIVAFSGTVQDITARKAAESQRHQTQEAFAKLVENAPYGVYVVDSQFRVALTDPGSRTEAFRNVDPLDGRDFGEVMRILWPEPLASQIITIFRKTLETGEPFYSERFRNSRRDLGEVKAYEWELHRITLPDGQFGVVCYYFDSTEMRNTEDALLRQRERADFVGEGSDVGFWFCDLPFDKVIWDKRVKQHFWLPPDDSPVTMEIFYSLLHPDDREPTRKAIDNSINNNQQYDVEYRTLAPDGRERWVRANGRTFYDEAGKPVRFDGITQDITARKQVEEALRASEARYRELAGTLEQQVQARTSELRERSEELMRTSEELRILSGRLLQVQDEERRRIARDLHDSSGQILTAIGLDLANIAECAKSEKILAIFPQLLAQVEESQKLVDMLHRELRTTTYLLHPPLLDEAGLFSAISWYVQGMTQRSGVGIEFDFAKDFGRLSREMELLVFRLVQESMTNIHRHSGSKTAGIRIRRLAEAITVEIEDRGRGIPPEKLAEIESGVSGLGIRAMRERLRQFGGDLKIHSNGAGTRVFVTIPLAQTSQAANGIERVEAAI
jgi:PAS domain S-box-containing protein